MDKQLKQMPKEDLIAALRDIFSCIGSTESGLPLLLHDYGTYDDWTFPSSATQLVYDCWRAEARALLEGE